MRWLPFAACAIALASPARGDGIGASAVGVIAVGGHRAEVATVAAAVIRERGAGRVVDDAVAEARAQQAAGAVPVEQLRRFARVREEIDEGWRAYLRVQFDYAQARLAAARTDAEALLALPEGTTLYADAALRLGVVLAHLGRAKDSADALALAVALDPARPITLDEFSPDVVAAVGAARARAPARREVELQSDPPGALLEVDGAALGRASIRAQLAIGQHVVVARAPLEVARGMAFAVGLDTGEVTVALERDTPAARLAAGAAAGMPAGPAAELVDATLRYAELDELFVVAQGERRGGPALLVQRCAGAPARCTAIVELGYAPGGLVAATRAAWAAVRTADVRYPPDVFADPRRVGTAGVAHRCTACRSPWLWGGIGTAAVIGAIAIVAAVSASRPPPTVMVSPSGFTGP